MTGQNSVSIQSARDARDDRILTCQLPGIKGGWYGQEPHTIPASVMPVGGPVGPHRKDRTQTLLVSSTCRRGQVTPTSAHSVCLYIISFTVC